MKKTVYFLCFIALFGCNKIKTNKEELNNSDSKIVSNEILIINKTKDTIDVWNFGKMILDNKISPTDDDGTFACVKQLYSNNQKTRDFFFKVFVLIMAKADGALAETIGDDLRDILLKFPDFYLREYFDLQSIDKKNFSKNLASGLYFEYCLDDTLNNNEIDRYFATVQSKMKDRSVKSDYMLKELKNSSLKELKLIVGN